MKTSKQHSKEIFEKIAKREAARVRTKKRVLRTFAFCIMFGFVVPFALFSIKDNGEYRPLSKPIDPPPIETPTPVIPDEELPAPPQMDKGGTDVSIVLFL